ncbi:hypothetical protein F4818DRAFT_436654 [Hypoxylon cercidicola]|nr:hypothetical protein F4818DRAFT_436654 [Hypoxylon cercidicola]
MDKTVVPITGGNRGLGLGLVKRFLTQPNHIVIAAVRSPNHMLLQSAGTILGTGSDLIGMEYDASVWDSAGGIVTQLLLYNVHHIDIVVANAGITKTFSWAKDVTPDDMREHFEVNVLGGVALRQPILASVAYGASKSMVTWFGVRINFEESWLNCFVLDPSRVETQSGNAMAQYWGLQSAPDSIDKSCDGMFHVLTTATKEQYGGKIVAYNGEVQPW